MKRIILIVILIVAGVGITGFFLPSKKVVSKSANATIPFDGISRIIVNKDQWKNWWPGSILNDSTLSFNGISIHINLLLLNGFKAVAVEGNQTINIDLQSIATYNAETAMTLTTSYSFSSNPFTKIIQHITAIGSQKKFDTLIETLKNRFSDIKTVYGFDIKIDRVPNSSYVSVKQNFDHYPSNGEIYKMIDEIKIYINGENGKAVNDPILNIVKESETTYAAMVAVASDKQLPNKGKFMQKNMMLGNIVVAKVTGGFDSIEKCRQAVQFYVNDFRKLSPAIAFERMISNRLTEDSSKWVSTINYPVFQ